MIVLLYSSSGELGLWWPKNTLNILKFVSLKCLKRKAQDLWLHCSFSPDMQKSSFVALIGANFSILIFSVTRRKWFCRLLGRCQCPDLRRRDEPAGNCRSVCFCFRPSALLGAENREKTARRLFKSAGENSK